MGPPEEKPLSPLRRSVVHNGFACLSLSLSPRPHQWHALSREEQAKYYELARKERQLHMQLYPGWSARDNYVGGSFFPGLVCRRVLGVQMGRGALTAHLDQASEPFSLPTAGAVSISSGHQAQRGCPGLQSGSPSIVREQGGAAVPVFLFRTREVSLGLSAPCP